MSDFQDSFRKASSPRRFGSYDEGEPSLQGWSHSSSASGPPTDEEQFADTMTAAGQALAYGTITAAEYETIRKIGDTSDRRSFVERTLRYREHMPGALGRLADPILIVDTFGGNRFITSAAKATTEAAKGDGGFKPFAALLGKFDPNAPIRGLSDHVKTFLQGFTVGFSPDEFRRAAAERTSYSDILASGGNQGAAMHAAGFMMDVFLDPTTYLTFGVSAGAKVVAGRGSRAILAASAGVAEESIPRALRANAWGHHVLRRAVSDAVEESPELLAKNVVEKFRTGASHIDAYLYASTPEFQAKITEYAIRHYDRISGDLIHDGMKASGWNPAKRITDIAETNAGPASMFEETYNSAMTAAYGKLGGKLTSVRDFSFLGGMFGSVGAAAATNLLGAPGFDTAAAVAGFVVAGSPKAREVLSNVGRLTPGWDYASKKIVGSTANFIDTHFRSVTRKLPDDLRAQYDEINNEATQRVNEGKKLVAELIERKGLTAERRSAIGRHMDDPSVYSADDDVADVVEFFRKGLDDIHERESKHGIGTRKLANYVTHYYGSHDNMNILSWIRGNSEGPKQVASLEREFLDTENRYRLARKIATFDDADEVFGKGVVVDDIAEIYARRLAASEKVIAKARMMDIAIERYGIQGVAQQFKSNFHALSTMAQRLGKIDIDFSAAPIGPQHTVADSSIDVLTSSLMASPEVKRLNSAGQSIGQVFSSTDKTAVRGQLEKFALEAYDRPLAELTQSQFDQMDDFLRSTFMGDLQSSFSLGNKDMVLVEFSGGRSLPRRTHLTDANVERRAAFQMEDEVPGAPSGGGIDVMPQAVDASQSIAKRQAMLRHRANAVLTKVGDQKAGWIRDADDNLVAEARKAEASIAKARRSGDEARIRKAEKRHAPTLRRFRKYEAARGDAALVASVKQADEMLAEARRLDDAQPTAARHQDDVAPIEPDYKAIAKNVSRAVRKLAGAVGSKAASIGTDKISLFRSVANIDPMRRAAARDLAAIDKRFATYEANIAADLAKDPYVHVVGQYKDLADLEQKLDELHTRIGDDAILASRNRVLDLMQEYSVVRGQRMKDAAPLEKSIAELDDQLLKAAVLLSDKKFVEEMDKLEGLTTNLRRKQELVKDLKRRAKEISDHRAVRSAQDEGHYYVPKIVHDAIEELHGVVHTHGVIDQTMLALKKTNNLFKAPMLLAFADYWIRNGVQNTAMTAAWAGIKMLNPMNVVDTSSVVGVLATKKGKLNEKLRARVINLPNGVTTTAGAIADEAVRRGITLTHTTSEYQFLSELHGPLIGMGGLKAAFQSARNPLKAARRALDAPRGAVYNEILSGLTRATRPLQFTTETMHRVAMFTLAAKETGSFVHATNEVSKYLGNFARLSATEQKYMTAVFPFYSWTRFAIGRSLDQFHRSPAWLATQGKALQMAQRIVSSRDYGDEDRDLSSHQPWLDSSIGITARGPGDYAKKLMVFGVLEDEALRIAYDAGKFAQHLLHYGAKAIGADSFAYQDFIRPDPEAKDGMRFLANVAFIPKAIAELVRQREFYSGSAIGGDALEADEGFSRLKNARHLIAGAADAAVGPAHTPFIMPDNAVLQKLDSYGARAMHAILGVNESGEGKPFTRWLIGAALPTARFYATYERRLKARMAYKESGDEVAYDKEIESTAMRLLGSRAYLYDPAAQKKYANRSRIDAMKQVLIDSDAMEQLKIEWQQDPLERALRRRLPRQ